MGLKTRSFTTWDLMKILAACAVVLMIIVLVLYCWYKKIGCFRKHRRESPPIPNSYPMVEPYSRQWARQQNFGNTRVGDAPPSYNQQFPTNTSSYQEEQQQEPPSYYQATEHTGPNTIS